MVRRPFTIAPFLFALLLLPLLSGTAGAQAWDHVRGKSGADAWIDNGGMQLRISCNPALGGPFFLTLSGGPHPGMKNIDDTEDSMMMWIDLPNGNRARHPIDGHYFAPDDTFVGRFVVNDHVLGQFANGREMSLTGAGGVTILTVPMKGTGAARNMFKEACGV